MTQFKTMKPSLKPSNVHVSNHIIRAYPAGICLSNVGNLINSYCVSKNICLTIS